MPSLKKSRSKGASLLKWFHPVKLARHYLFSCNYGYTVDMTDHAGPRRRCEFLLVTKFWQQLLLYTFPPPLDQNNLFRPYKKRSSGAITSMGGCQKLVPNWHSQRRGPVWSVICPMWAEIIFCIFFLVPVRKIISVQQEIYSDIFDI